MSDKKINNIWRNFNWNYKLSKKEIHIFLCDLDRLKIKYDFFYFLISKEEKEKAEKFHFERDKICYVISHGILRTLLSQYLNMHTNEIFYEINDFGKPFLKNGSNEVVFFNLSHSKDFCLIGINSLNDIGVDIEFIKEDFEFENIVEKYFVKNEIDQIFIHPNEELQRQAFYNCWTRKEAFIKAVGKGLSIPFNDFEVEVNNSKPKVKIYSDNLNEANWQLFPVEINIQYTGAICTSKNNLKFNYWLIF